MGTEDQNQNGGTGGAAGGGAGGPTGGDGAAGGGASDGQGKAGGGANVLLTSKALKERLERSTETGRKAALADMDKQAQELGFTNHAAMVEHYKVLKAKGNDGSAGNKNDRGNGDGNSNSNRNGQGQNNRNGNGQSGKNGQGDGGDEKLSREDRKVIARLTRERDTLQAQLTDANGKLKASDRKGRDLQRRIDANEARGNLEKAAIVAGAKDVDYVVAKMIKALEGKTSEEVRAFDEAKFFETLKTEQPYLFGEVTRPATTGTGASGAEAGGGKPAGGNGGAAGAGGKANADGTVDVRKLNPKEFEEHLRKKGINPETLVQ